MATLKGIKRAARSESLSGKVMVDTVRGVLRVRKWPRKRGTPKSASQRWWNDWFRQANLLAKYVDAATMRKAIELTANTGMYPRDIILKAMRGRLYIWQDQTGKVWYPMAAIQDISESLDVLAQAVGSVLVRAADRWRAPEGAAIGNVLTYQGEDAAPVWGPSAAGGLTYSQLAFGASEIGNYASQGWGQDVAVPVTVYGASVRLSGTGSLAGFVGLYLCGAGTWDISEVLAVTPTVLGPTSALPYLYLPFDTPVAVAADARLIALWTRTDATSTTNSRLLRTRDRNAALPAGNSQATAQLATLLPAVPNTLTLGVYEGFCLNLLYKI